MCADVETKREALGGADFAICVAVSPKAFEQAFGSFVAVEPPCSLGFPLTSTCSYRFLRS
jgi:hypothetical protein